MIKVCMSISDAAVRLKKSAGQLKERLNTKSIFVSPDWTREVRQEKERLDENRSNWYFISGNEVISRKRQAWQRSRLFPVNFTTPTDATAPSSDTYNIFDAAL